MLASTGVIVQTRPTYFNFDMLSMPLNTPWTFSLSRYQPTAVAIRSKC